VDIGSLEHDSQSLADLSVMAGELARVIFSRARGASRLHGGQVVEMVEAQRQASRSLPYVMTRRRSRQREFDAWRKTAPGSAIGASSISGVTGAQVQALAAVFRFVSRQQFGRVARELPLCPGAVEWVNLMRRQGTWVGVVSESWFVAAEINRRRLFADFALAHVLHFDGDTCTGRMQLQAAYQTAPGSPGPGFCKSRAVAHFRDDPSQPQVNEVWVVGKNHHDLALLQAADRAFVVAPGAHGLAQAAGAVGVSCFQDLMAHVPERQAQLDPA
jgi:glucosyl-3-phosphoglycerate synthase